MKKIALKIAKHAKFIQRVQVVSLTVFLFILSFLFLIEAPSQISNLQKSVVALAGESTSETSNNIGQVAGVEKKRVVVIKNARIVPPNFISEAVLAQDFDSGQILYEKNIHKRMLPASTTKIMTALVASDYFQPDSVLTVTQDSLAGGSTMGLELGEKLTFRSLLYGMLLPSGNDAAYTIADNYPGGFNNFVLAMNQKAQNLNLSDTHFDNPAGFDSPGQYSSAFDLARIAEEAAQNPQLAKVVSTKDIMVSSLDSSKQHVLENLNQLLGQDGVIGFKTGTTDGAGENLVGLVDRNSHKVITVVLDSTDRFGETKSLMDWVYQNYSWEETLQ